MASAQVNVRPGNGVERDIRGLDRVVDRRKRAVVGALAQELDEGMQVVVRLPRPRPLMEGLVGREHQRQVTVEQAAELLEAARESLPAGAARGQDRVHRRAEVGRELTHERTDQRIQIEALPPEGRARAAGHLSHTLERQPVPATLAEDLDRGVPELFVDLQHLWFIHAT